MPMISTRLAALPTIALFALCAVSAPAPKPAAAERFDRNVAPLLKRNCAGCHNDKLKSGDLSLAGMMTVESVASHTEEWEKIATKLLDGTMPPKGMPRPEWPEIEAATAWIHDEIKRVELATKPDPGRVTARRLNRAEYNNTVRDLLGVDVRPADDFPQDDSGYGFDNIGDVLSLSPVLLEKYLKAAESAVRIALAGAGPVKPMVLRSQPPGREFELYPKPQAAYDESGLTMPNSLHARLKFPAAGEYTVRAALEGRRPNGSEPVSIGIWVDGKLSSTIDIDAPSDGGSIDLFGAQGETKLRIPAGEHWIAGTLLKLYEGLPPSYGGPNPSKRPEPPPPDISRFLRIPKDATPEKIEQLKKEAQERFDRRKVPANRVWVHFIEAIGPYEQEIVKPVESRKRIFTCGHPEGPHAQGCERTILSRFARRAFRRPVTEADVKPYLDLVAKSRTRGSDFDEAIGAGLQAILVSPDFLFRIEKTAGPANAGVAPVSQIALASRLSYFLWSSLPDEPLLRAAETGTLRQPAVLAAQVRRMLRDPKSQALVENFAGQWLELRRLESVAPDGQKFPEFDDYLRLSMERETQMFFANLMKNDLSILDLIDGRYTFINEKLARLYGIEGVTGTEFRRVPLDGVNRGGILTHASVLTVSSYATRTSPVLRGKWILENFLNEPVPPPPPNVPVLEEETIGAAASLRAQMEQHRTNPACASCHAKMDPIGFGFENFNAIGQWRAKDGKFEIDPAGALPDGRAFNGPGDLRKLIAADRDKFAECVADKMLTYALGRGLERYDRRTVKSIAANVAAAEYKFSSVVMEIVRSLPFQMARQELKKL